MSSAPLSLVPVSCKGGLACSGQRHKQQTVGLAGTVVSPILFSSLPAVCDLWFPEVDMLSFYIIVAVKIFRHKLV